MFKIKAKAINHKCFAIELVDIFATSTTKLPKHAPGFIYFYSLFFKDTKKWIEINISRKIGIHFMMSC